MDKAYSQLTWTGSQSDAWNNALNWSPSTKIPDSTTSVIIPSLLSNGAPYPLITTTGMKAKDVTINAGGIINMKGGSLDVAGNWSNSGTFSATSGTVQFVGSGTVSISGTSVTAFPALVLSNNTKATEAVSLYSDASCTSLMFTNVIYGTTLTVYQGITLTVNGNTIINQAANGSNAHGLVINGGNVIMNGNLIFSVTSSSSGRLAKLQFSAGGSVAVNGDINMNNTLDAAMSVIDMSGGGGSFYLAGNFNLLNLGTLYQGTATNSNFVYKGTGAQTIRYGTTVSYRTLTIDKPSGVATLANALNVLNLTLSGGYVSAGVYSITVSGDFLNNGGDFSDAPAMYFIGSNNSISGSALTHFGPVSFNTGGTTSYTVNSHIAVTSLTIPRGTKTQVTLSSGSEMYIDGDVVLNQPLSNTTSAWIIGGTATVTGNISLNSLNTTASSVIKINITGVLDANGDIIYNSASDGSTILDMTAGSGILNLKGSISLVRSAGTFSSSTTSSLNLSGTSSQILGVSGQFKFNDISITNPVSVSLQLNGTVSSLPVTGNLSIQSGVFSNGGIGINMSSGKVMSISDGASFRLTGSSGMVSGTGITKSFSTNSTVEYAGTTQSVSPETYGNLLLSGTTLNAAGSCNVQGNLTIGAGATFNAGAYTHNIFKNFTNNGSFNASTGSIQLTGTLDASLSGATTFNNLNINKSTSVVSLQSNVSAATVAMTAGIVNTGNNTLTITSGRSGNGIILGNIKRSHSFSNGVAYAFESPNNTITFSSPSSISSVTVSVTTGTVNDFTSSNSIHRQYSIIIPAGTFASAILRLHYENTELNGLTESGLQLWKYTSAWTAMSTTAGDTTNNYVELSGVTDITGRWTLAGCDLKTSFTYTGTPYCSNAGTAAVTYNNGASAGTFSASPGGLVLNTATGEVNPGSSTPGSYTVTNTKTNGSCSSISTASITINAAGHWTGAISSDWNNAANWLCGGVPTGLINVLIPAGLTNYPVINPGTASANNISIEANASLTLTNATLEVAGSINNSGTLSAGSATIEMNGTTAQTIPATAFSGNAVKSLTINNPAGVTLSGPLSISDVLTISNGSLNTGGYLTLTSTATSSARIAPITSSASNPVIGNVTVQRYIQGRRKYRLITSPVTTSAASSLVAGQEELSIWGNWQNAGNTSVANNGTYITGGNAADGYDQVTSNPSLFTYDATNRIFVPFSSSNGNKTKYTPLKAGVPYYMFIYGDRKDKVNTNTPAYTILSSTGTLLTGDQVYNNFSAIPLSTVSGRYTLLGNPFASPINWASLPKTGIENTFWGWDPNLNSTGGYVTVSTSGTITLIAPFTGSAGLDQYIQGGQGFFVRTNGPSPSLAIREQDKVANYNANAFRVASDLPLMAVNLYYDNAGTKTLADGVLIAFDNLLVQKKAGGSKLANASESLSIAGASGALSIDVRKVPQSKDTIFLNLSSLSRPQYSLEIFGQNLNRLPLKPYLYDHYKNNYTLLSATDTNRIDFTIVSTDSRSSEPGRFSILFLSSPPPATIAGVADLLQVFPNPVKDQVKLSVKALDAGLYRFGLFTTTGQKVVDETFTHPGGDAVFSVTLNHLPGKGIYYIRLAGAKGSFNQKVYIDY